MRRYLFPFVVCCFALVMGMSTARAGGSSDTSGHGFHCYLFFELPDEAFAQAMMNDSDADEVLKKADEFIEKYEDNEGGILAASIGNVDGDGVCGSSNGSGNGPGE